MLWILTQKSQGKSINQLHAANIADCASANAGFDIFDDDQEYEKRPNGFVDASDFIVDIREYDVPYHVRVSIDLGMDGGLIIIGCLTDCLQISGSASGTRLRQNTELFP
jgi:hypothetical protein